MTRITTFTPLLVAAALTRVVAGSVAGADPPARPNVVVILADDLGYADVGVHGCRDIPTPHIDRLARSGVRCTSGYSAHPFCSPMRASLMAVRYQHRFGYERNIAYDPHNNHMGLPAGETTVAARLERAGYHTGMVGKWHLGAARPFHPNRRGFNFFYGFLGGGHDYLSVDLGRPMGEGYFAPIERNGKAENIDGYLTTALTDAAVGFIESQRAKPFFLYVAYNAPHTPMQAPPDVLERFAGIDDERRRSYAAMVSVMDDGVGQILDCLERLELRRSTLVFFLSDNGGPEQSNASRNDPLRGQKGDVYEGGIRVPFLVSWPGTIPADATYDQPVISIDVSRTALAVAGAGVDDAKLDGADLIPSLTGGTGPPPREALFWRKENGAAFAVRAGNLKLVQAGQSRQSELFDLDKDIAESRNVAAERPGDVRRLAELYHAWNNDNRPPFFPSYREYHEIMDKLYREIGDGAGK